MSLDIDRAIGLFHVHGHKAECLYRFASSFIPGAGIVAGEIIKSLWATLNTITPATRKATLAHWAEIIDDHTGDSNFKKTIRMGWNVSPRLIALTDYFWHSGRVGRPVY
jgi:hypothetical protein